MVRNLRLRMVLSHVVLLLVSILLIGVALIYVLDTQVLLPSLSRELASQAVLVATMARANPAIWQDPAQAQDFVRRVGPAAPTQLMLLAPDGRLLASTAATDATAPDPTPTVPVSGALADGQPHASVYYSPSERAEVAEALIAVTGPDGAVAGFIRLVNPSEGVMDQIGRLHTVIFEVLAEGLVIGSIVGLILGMQIGQPLERATNAVQAIADGKRLSTVPEQGPEEMRLLLRAVNTLVERLRTLENSRRQLLSRMIHELGRPLGAMGAAVHALRGGAGENPALRESLLAGIDGELRRLHRVINDLAGLQDQISGSMAVYPSEVDLAEWLPTVVLSWAEAAQQKNLQWQVALAPNLPCLMADPDRLGLAIGNLLSNAIKYTPAGGTVSVDAAVHDSAFRLCVGDTGPGIPLAEQEHVFEPFFRGASSGRFAQGMGLGLSIARDAIQAHGGSLTLESAPGSGSHFIIEIPLREPCERPPAGKAPPRP